MTNRETMISIELYSIKRYKQVVVLVHMEEHENIIVECAICNKNFISLEKWPKADEKKIDKNLEKQEQLIEKLIEDINHVSRLIKEREKKEIKKVFVYVLPNEEKIFQDENNLIKKRTDLEIEIYAVDDKDKYDPQGKSKKTKPGKPAIFLE